MRLVGTIAVVVALLVLAGVTSAQTPVDSKAAQEALKSRGHNPGPIDGIVGPRTQKAIRDFQKASGLEQTGKLDEKTVSKLTAPTVKGLVSSLGGFTATVTTPVTFSGATVELEPGGQTGRQMFRVPTFVYVVEGVLTTDYEAGPVGIKGVQYHAGGQSFMDNGGWWHNHMNKTDKPVKYLILHTGYPGAAIIQKPEAE